MNPYLVLMRVVGGASHGAAKSLTVRAYTPKHAADLAQRSLCQQLGVDRVHVVTVEKLAPPMAAVRDAGASEGAAA